MHLRSNETFLNIKFIAYWEGISFAHLPLIN